MSFTIYDEHTLRSVWTSLDSTSTPGTLTMLQAGTLGARMDVLLAANNDVVDHIVFLDYGAAADDGRIGSVNVPARQGFDGTPALDVLAAMLPVSAAGITIAGNETVFVGTDDTLASGKVISLVGSGGDF